MATAQPQGAAGGTAWAAAKPGLRKPVFVKVERLKPGTGGYMLMAKVLSSKMVLHKGQGTTPHLRQSRIAECLIGDETNTILFTARNDQADGFDWKQFEGSEEIYGVVANVRQRQDKIALWTKRASNEAVQ